MERIKTPTGEDLEAVTSAELIRLGAADPEFFNRAFFPHATRMKSPAFHREIDTILENPANRLVNIRSFRGSAKTTKLRMFPARRIAYGLSRTILWVGASEPHAERSIGWLKRRIEPRMTGNGSMQQPLFARTFGLQKGAKWDQTSLEIIHTGFEEENEFGDMTPWKIWVLGVGITSNSLRGINFEDYRPDLIILDDIVTDENAANVDQRTKISDLVFGSLLESLAPASEEPNAKLVFLQTPLHPDDVASKAAKDPGFITATYGCWTDETEDLDVQFQESRWPERWPSSVLRQEKLDATQRNKLSVFQREKECKFEQKEATVFLSAWINFDTEILPVRPGCAVLAIDPVPPPPEDQFGRIIVPKSGLKTDFEVHQVWQADRQGFHLVDTERNRGHDPGWSVTTALTLARRWRVMRIVVEGVLFQKVLKWILEQEMRKQRFWIQVEAVNIGTKAKVWRIKNAMTKPASEGRIFCRPEHSAFITQFNSLSEIAALDHDDDIDCASLGVSSLDKPYLDLNEDEWHDLDDRAIPKLSATRRCP